MPGLYHDAKEGQHIVGFVRKSVFDALAQGEEPVRQASHNSRNRSTCCLSTQSLPDHWKRDVPVSKPVPLPAFSGPRLAKDTVVIGIIDDGIAFAHERFRLADGTTRVQYFWRQDGTFDNDYSTVDFGSEVCKLGVLKRKGIDDLLRDHAQAGLVDEEGLYQEAGFIDFRDRDHKAAAWGLSHGTHVLDLAAGYDSAKAPMSRPIIAVQLPVSVTADTAGSNLKSFTKLAINYILDRADRLAGGGGCRKARGSRSRS